MILYNIGSLLKILIGTIITYIITRYVNPYQDPGIALSFWFIGIFLIVWGTSFYIYYISQRFFSEKGNLYLASKSYKLSLLTGLYIIINVALIIMENWSKFIGIIIFVIFIFLQLITFKESENYK